MLPSASVPNATVTSASPAMIAWRASCTAVRPEQEAWSTVNEGIVNGSFARTSTWRVTMFPLFATSICAAAAPIM